MSPRGLGLRLNSRQLHAVDGDSFAGLNNASSCISGTPLGWALEFPLVLRTLTGLLLFGLGLLPVASVLESDDSSSRPSAMAWGVFTRFLADARVIGPEYPSCDVSEGVGDGEITLGVAGIARGGIIWSKVGSAQQGATPTIVRRIFRSRSKLYVE